MLIPMGLQRRGIVSQPPLTTLVAEALPEGTPPLYESINTDALNQLLTDRDTPGRIEFEHDGHQITITHSEEGSAVRTAKLSEPEASC